MAFLFLLPQDVACYVSTKKIFITIFANTNNYGNFDIEICLKMGFD